MPAIQPRCGQAADTSEPEFCVEGCDCPTGLLLHENKCILPSDCPCTYHSKIYQNGDTIPNDCNSWWVILMSVFLLESLSLNKFPRNKSEL